ncbi:hypothetical protein [Pontibacter populi]|uniref:DUF5004 domain-containing protein n=1 Tax=Pontibacter populi TaxID=890055 RepID=A0ABV1RVN6_9BACT
MKKLTLIIFCIFSVFTTSCDEKFDNTEFIGEWKANEQIPEDEIFVQFGKIPETGEVKGRIVSELQLMGNGRFTHNIRVIYTMLNKQGSVFRTGEYIVETRSTGEWDISFGKLRLEPSSLEVSPISESAKDYFNKNPEIPEQLEKEFLAENFALKIIDFTSNKFVTEGSWGYGTVTHYRVQ